MSRKNGFTLVELLVVITIIGVLVALLVPAILAARENARQVQCINNQRELATAILKYEVEKNHFPGCLNPGGVNWCMAILGNLGRLDLWEGEKGTGGWRSGNGPVVQLPQFFCQSNRAPDNTTPKLGYAVNSAIFKDLSNAATAQVNWVTQSQLKAADRTVMLGERLGWPLGAAGGTGGTGSTGGTGGGQAAAQIVKWTDKDVAKLAFTWGATGTPVSPTVFSSNHPGIVIMTFCDQHTEKVREDLDCDPDPTKGGFRGLAKDIFGP